MAKFSKKPVVIEAVKWNGDNIPEIVSFYGGACGFNHGDPAIQTAEGEMRANKGDRIIKGVKGEFYPCKPDIFAATYEPVAEEIRGEA